MVKRERMAPALLRSRATTAFMTLIMALGITLTVSAAENPYSSIFAPTKISVGIEGVYKNGFQTPVRLSFQPMHSEVADVTYRLELETRDTDGAAFFIGQTLTKEELRLGEIELSFVFPKSRGNLVARVKDSDGKTIWSKELSPGKSEDKELQVVFNEPANPSKPIYLVVGDDKIGFADAFGELRLKEERRPQVVKVSSFRELPESFLSYECVDRLFFTTSDLALYEGMTLESKEIKAVEEWTLNGGNVVVLAGKNSAPLLTENGVLSGLAPGVAAPQTHEFRSVNAFTNDLQNVKNLAMTGTRSNPFLQVPVIKELKEGTIVEMREAETPLLTSRAVGLGTVVFFAADLGEAPIANWSGRGRLLLKILGIDPDVIGPKDASASMIKRGYVDFSGQIRSALDVFDGVKTTPFSALAVLLLLYVLAIAPFDWFLVKKVFKRPILTWVAFPLEIVAFIVVGVAWYRHTTPQHEILNQLDVVDVDLASGRARDVSWFGFYSPVGNRYDLEFTPKISDYRITSGSETAAIFPLTLSGEGLGGAEQKAFSPKLWDEQYSVESDALRRFPAATRSSKSFVGRWYGALENLPEFTSLSDDGLSLKGSVINPFNSPIYNACLIYKGGACELGTLPPGETVIERGAARLEPMRILNEQRSSVPTDRLARWDSSSYNSASKRLPYIVRAASFYEFAGGVDNFGTEKRLQRDLDLTALLRCGRAVIYGVVVDPECEEYRPSEDTARLSADALEMERLNEKLARQKGEEYRNRRLETPEKYGRYGTTPEFVSSIATTSRSNEESVDPLPASKRTVVVRIITPIRLGSHPTTETK